MYNTVLEKLRSAFITIRHSYSGGEWDKERLDAAVADMKTARSTIQKSKLHEKRLYVYCIDTLISLIAEGDNSKIRDFADTVHNIPEIGLERRNVYSFHREITSFRKKYGESYFPNYNRQKIRPKFTQNAPENAAEFFLPDSDETFKKIHPLGYKILVMIGIIALLLPMWAYVAYMVIINPVQDGWRAALGILGFISTFVMGIGFFNIVAAWIHQYLGHKVTVGCILGGGAVTALVLFLQYC